ncbi:MAG: iron ABC transporter permease [Clostridia bacterium]|nr:iron ABC transporter permease [Clostridia bacterium]
MGKYQVSPGESLSILWCSLWGLPCDSPQMTINVVLSLRIPRILASILVGAAMALSGAAYQGIFCNPLISPDFLGVSSGACIGAAIAILLGLPGGSIQLFAFLGGIAAVAMAMTLPVLLRNHSNLMLVLSGIIVGSAMSSILGFIKYVADPDTQLAAITYWTMGSFNYITLRDILPTLPFLLLPTVLLSALSWRIDLLSLGESEALALGVDVRAVRTAVILCATLLTASSVCIAGTISWVGLIIPHLGRMLVGPDNTRLLPISGLLGGIFMLLADTLARTVSVDEMPISILTGIVGAPFYAWLLWRQRGGSNGTV